MVRCSRVDESRWLLAVNSLIQMTMKKGVLDIQLMNRPGTRRSNAENNPNRCWLNNWIESLFVVDAILLRKSSNNPQSFVTSKRAIRVILMLENPLAGDNVGTRRPWYESPSAIVNKCLVFIHHCGPPIWISKGAAIIGRKR